MAEDLDQAFQKLAGVPIGAPLTRERWILRHHRLDLSEIECASVDGSRHRLEAAATISRIGSFWFRDEECHVYTMDQSIRMMVENKHQRPGADLLVVTPLWVFIRNQNGIVHITNPDAMRVAEKNFMKFLDDVYQRWRKAHG